MFTMYTQAPAPGFSKVTQAQLLRADRQAFLRLAEMVTSGFKPNAAGTLPLDEALDRLHTDVTVTYHMLPLPQGKDPKADKDPRDDREGPYGKVRRVRVRSLVKAKVVIRDSPCLRNCMECTIKHHLAKQYATTTT